MECLFNVSFSEKLMYLKAMSIRRTLYILGIILFIPTSECLTINSTISDLFIKNLTETYGTDGRISITELKLLLRNIHKVPDITDDKLIPATDDGHDHPNSKGASNCSGEKCPPLQCLSAEDVFHMYQLPLNSSLSPDDLSIISPTLVYEAQQYECRNSGTNDTIRARKHHGRRKPRPEESWGYGFLFVTVISLCSLVGIMVFPCMKKAYYKTILSFLVALAVGSLAGSGLLFLIPDAFGLIGEEDSNHEYIYKASTIMGGIYLFFMTERIMKMIINSRKKPAHLTVSIDAPMCHEVSDYICSIKPLTPPIANAEMRDLTTIPYSMSTCTTSELLPDNESQDKESGASSRDSSNMEINDTVVMKSANGNAKNNNRNHVKKFKLKSNRQMKTEIAPVAWMIIFGDGLHNFIDGLSIGAAFTDSILSGVSVSMAVICEELPHELGDFAILLNSGMTMKQALFYNFMSACMCYLGLIVGILLGENTSANDWIFAIAGGMFLYISLADMVPEMNSVAESEERNGQSSIKILFIQNLGMLSGFGVMFIMALFGEQIEFGS